MSRCTKRSSRSSLDAFKRRVARGDMNETEANTLDLNGVCECGAAMTYLGVFLLGAGVGVIVAWWAWSGESQ